MEEQKEVNPAGEKPQETGAKTTVLTVQPMTLSCGVRFVLKPKEVSNGKVS